MRLQSVYAALRKYGIAHATVLIAFIVPAMLFSRSVPWQELSYQYWLSLAVLVAPIIFSTVDAVMVWRLTQAIPRTVMTREFRTAYFYGYSWEGLREIARNPPTVEDLKAMAGSLIKRFEKLPLTEAEGILALIEVGQYAKANRLLIQRERRVAEESRSAKRREKQQVRLTGEHQALAHQGLELGIDKGELEDALRRGLDETRALIAYYERRAALLERAKKVGCESMTHSDLAAGEEHAAIRLAKAEALLTKADYYGIGAEVREDLSRGGIEFADYKVVKAEREAKRTAAIGELRRSIDTVSEEARHGLYVQLNVLRDCEFEGREYRRLKYALERDIDGVRARHRAS